MRNERSKTWLTDILLESEKRIEQKVNQIVKDVRDTENFDKDIIIDTEIIYLNKEIRKLNLEIARLKVVIMELQND